MTDLEINIAIAEMCGWGFLSKDKFIVIPPYSPYSVQPLSTIPDYINDLNAMREAEKTLSDNLLWIMKYKLDEIVPSDIPTEFATARQRAEAFLQTTGKWNVVN